MEDKLPMWVAGRSISKLVIVLIVPLAVAGLAIAAYALDTARHDGRVARNVELDGTLIGGLQLETVEASLQEEADQYGKRLVRIDLGDQIIEGTAATFGFSVDVGSTLEAVRSAGSFDGFWDGVGGWVARFRESEVVSTAFTFDPGVARTALARESDQRRVQPRQPSISAGEAGLELDSGQAGREIDVESTLAALSEWPEVDEVAGSWTPIPTDVSPGDAIALFTSLKRRTDEGLTLRSAGIERSVTPAVFASWVDVATREGSLVVDVDDSEVYRHVEAAFFGYAQGALTPTYEVVDGQPIAVAIEDTRRICCDASVVIDVVARVLGEREGPIDVPLRSPSLDEQAADIESMGIAEPVGDFTTFHSCCESRVTNIHRIADLTQGVLIQPGGEFSVNEHIGERTRENGFVDGGVIYQGQFQSDVGGGISQFATTLFNAAFFAGLDYSAYQSHSIYLDRYPYGREATLSWPEPDLVIANPGPYAVLIWSTYDERSITVTLYSTKTVDVTQTDQRVDRWRSCTRVTTHRLREYRDGTSVEDAVFALYRPSAGYSCDGLPEDEGEDEGEAESDAGSEGQP